MTSKNQIDKNSNGVDSDMRDDSCIFCKIIAKEIPANPVYENDSVIVLPDIMPSSPGHIMVIPKKHAASILNFDEKELGVLMLAVKNMAQAIDGALHSDSITIGINHLEKNGVHHLHIHLIPRWNNDKGGSIQKVVHNPPQESLQIISEKLKRAIVDLH